MKIRPEDIIKDPKKTVKPKMNDYQRVAIIAKENGSLMIVHTKPFRETMAWAEFDADTRRLTLLSRSGSIHDTGIDIHPDKIEMIESSKFVSVVWMVDKKIKDVYTLPLTLRDTGLISASIH